MEPSGPLQACNGTALPLPLPIWVETIRRNRNLTKYKRIQRLINIKIAEAYRTVSQDASCATAGVRPI